MLPRLRASSGQLGLKPEDHGRRGGEANEKDREYGDDDWPDVLVAVKQPMKAHLDP
jgi:hypothetical protein